MKIAVISSPFEMTPPAKYGGSERVASLLTEGLVKHGHSVTLFATSNSQTQARLIGFYDTQVRPYLPGMELTHVTKSLLEICKGDYDLVHNHTEFGVALSVFSPIPVVTTLHNDLLRPPWAEAIPTLYESFADAITVAISDRQADIGRQYGINVTARIHNAVDANAYSYSDQHGTYLAFLGLLGPHKGIQHAVRVAQETGIPLKIAGKQSSNPKVRQFYDDEIAPHVDGKLIEYVGELNDAEKIRLLKDALALLFPVTWEEPFGLVTIEAMACGTPVIAFNRGSVPEIIEHNVTGFIVENVEQMVATLPLIKDLNRADCRQHVLNKFDSERMITEYERLYEHVIHNHYAKR